MLLYRILRSRGRFLGRVKVNSVQGSSVLGKDADQRLGEYGTFGSSSSNPTSHIDHPLSRNVYLPINHGDGSNPAIALSQPYPGIFIYRFSEGFNYPNANHTLEYMVECIFEQTRRTSLNSYPRPGDRPWNDPGPSKRALKKALRGEINLNAGHEDLPTVQAIILDFSAVNFVDVTSVQALIDVRNQLDRYAAPDFVDWHIACINNRWAKRALVAAGFGYPNERPDGQHHRWQSIFSVAEMGGEDSPAAQAEAELNEKTLREREHPGKVEEGLHNPDHINVAETGSASGSSQEDEIKKTATRDQGSRLRQRRAVAVHSANRPLFHVDLTSALQSAIANVEARASAEPRSTGEDEDAKNV